MAKIKFPNKMPAASNIAGNDKILIADAVTGESKQATWNQAKSYLEITGIELEPLASGALPTPPFGEQRKMEVVGPATWTHASLPGGSASLTSGQTGLFYWNGSTWALTNVVNMPIAEPTGEVAPDDERAVNGDKVFEVKRSILQDVIGTSSTPVTAPYSFNASAVTNSNTLYSFFGYKNQVVLLGNKVTRCTIAFSTAGTFSIMKVKDYRLPTQSVTKKTTYTVTVGTNILDFNETLESGESLVFVDDDDTAVFKYTLGSQDADSFYYKTKSSGAYTLSPNILNIRVEYENPLRLPYKVSDKITSFEKVNAEFVKQQIPYSVGGSNSNTIYRYFTYNNQKSIKNKPILSLDVNFSTAGTFTVFKGTNISTSDISVTDIQTFTVTTGENRLTFASPVILKDNEELVFVKNGDTAIFLYKTSGTISAAGNPVALGFSFQTISTNAWSSVMGDLCIGVNVEEKPIVKQVSTLIREPKISFLADSITTFASYVVSGNAVWYPKDYVNSVDKTWWFQLVKELGWEIDTNNSFSGAKISGTAASAFHNRVTNLGNPDVGLLFGGTNDYRDAVPLGEWNFTDLDFNVNVFRQALQKTLYTAITTYPLTKFYFMLPMYRNDSAHVNGFPTNYNGTKYLRDYQNAIIEACEMYGVEIIDTRFVISQYNATQLTGDGLHPNERGMKVLKDFVLKRLK